MVLTDVNIPSYLIYASQKGTAQGISENIDEQGKCNGINFSVLCISEIKIYQLKHSCLVFVASTTGEGEPPETARKFIKEVSNLIKKEEDILFHYTILGLGDTNYTNFCNFGKTLDKKLNQLGGKRFYNCGWADDGTGLEEVVEPWIENLFTPLKLTLTDLISDLRELNPDLIQFQRDHFKDLNFDNNFENTISKKMVEIMPRELYDIILEKFSYLDLIPEDKMKNHPLKVLQYDITKKLTLPVLPSQYIIVDIEDKEQVDVNLVCDAGYPFADSDLISCKILSCQRLTEESSVKKALEVKLSFTEKPVDFQYEPGDTIGVIVKNPKEEVDLLLNLLNLESKADNVCNISIDLNSKKKTSSIPKYIPKTFSLRYLFSSCLDIRTIPKKRFIHSLVEYTSDPNEKRRLQEMSSKEGSVGFNMIRQDGITFLDFLILFQSCLPPVSLLIENLGRLLPRPYSLTSSPLCFPNALSFVFNVIEIPRGDSIGFSRKGICTGWIDTITVPIQVFEKSLDHQLEALSLDDKNLKNDLLIDVYLRSNKTFRLPSNPLTPIIMVGPGTGVAPFIGFLKHRQCLIDLNSKSDKDNDIANTTFELGPAYLFFGCRHRTKDFLYEKELNSFCNDGTLTKLYTSFSRDLDSCSKYVQDNIAKNGLEISKLIENDAFIYVCGDAINMSKNVFDAFISVVQNHLNSSIEDAKKFMAQMQIKGRYLQDVWSS